MMKKQNCCDINVEIHSSSSSPPLNMHKDSQIISKAKPKIRIIHIFAPEIIKTDASNFRELVQRLTGKPTHRHHHHHHHHHPKKHTTAHTYQPVISREVNIMNEKPPAVMARGPELIKEEEDDQVLWNMEAENDSSISHSLTGGGFLSGFASDIDGFIQELGEFPMPSHIHAFDQDSTSTLPFFHS